MPYVHKPDIAEGLRACTKCALTKPLSRYYNNKNGYLGRNAECKDCMNARKVAWVATNPEAAYLHRRMSYMRDRNNAEKVAKAREKNKRWHKRSPVVKERALGRYLWKMYGLTLEQYRAMASAQEHKCAICDAVPVGTGPQSRLAVDHDHKTGLVRALLCRACNAGIGHFGENCQTLNNAIEYLRAHGA